MDNGTNVIRRQLWQKIINDCHNRPEGQSAAQWMKDNGISNKSYYYWQKKLRTEAYEQIQTQTANMPVVQDNNGIAFVEIKRQEPAINSCRTADVVRGDSPVAIIRKEDVSIAISEEIPKDLLSVLIQEVCHA